MLSSPCKTFIQNKQNPTYRPYLKILCKARKTHIFRPNYITIHYLLLCPHGVCKRIFSTHEFLKSINIHRCCCPFTSTSIAVVARSHQHPSLLLPVHINIHRCCCPFTSIFTDWSKYASLRLLTSKKLDIKSFR